MGIDDMMPSNGFDADSARYDRMNRTQQADFAPGQDAIFQQSDVFASSVTPVNSNSMSDVFSSGISSGGDMFGTFNSNPMGGLQPSMNSMMPSQPQQPTAPKSQDEQIFDAVVNGGKALFGVFSDVADSCKQLTPYFWEKLGRYVTIAGGTELVLGIPFKLLGLGFGLQMAIGGCVSAAVGSVLWFFSDAQGKNCTSIYKDENNTNQAINDSYATNQNGFGSFDDSSFNSTPAMGWGTESFDSQSSFGDFDNSGDSDDDFGGSDYDDEFGGSSDDDDDNWGDDWDVGSTVQSDAGMSTEEALSSLPDVPQGMYERNYLHNMFMKRLPTMKPDFATIREIDSDDDIFLLWDEYLRDAAGVAGCKEDYLPELLQLQENLFTIIVTCDRPQGFKPEAVANELVNIYAYKNGTKNENVFAKVDTIGRECKITIFNGTEAMISLKDMILQKEDFFKDTKNYMPVALGIDQLGNVITQDFKKLESVIITGMPRSGKSWFVQAVLTQMCAYVPPTELNIFICDPKEGISDFKAFVLPHVKKFVSGDDNIVNTLRQLVKREAPRRKKIIGDAGHVNIWDYKDKYPDVKLPIIYVVIDEVVTLAERMDKEVKQEFQGLLIELISQLPALGIRAFLIPHVLKNDVIAKTATDLVPCKISVKGDAEHIEKATGAKPKSFPYKLVNNGDMAVKLSNIPNAIYVHGPALTSSNPDNNDVFDYLRRVWTKLEASEVDNSVAKDAEDNKANQDLLKNLESGTENIEVFDNSNSDSSNENVDLFDDYF